MSYIVKDGTGSDNTRHVISPNNLEAIGSWSPTTLESLDRSLAAVHRSLPVLTSDLSARASLLRGFRAGLIERRPAVVALVVAEVGKLPHEAEAEFDYAISFIDYAITVTDGLPDVSQENREGGILRVPIGVAQLICPFNDPVAGLTRKIAPAIASGCPVIVQPSPRGMLCAELVEHALSEADAIGATTWLKCDTPTVAEHAMAHPGVGLVSFTGSTASGRSVAQAAGRNFARCVLELGGNNWFTVLGDADIGKAVEDLVVRKIKAAGQACSAVNRVAVHADIHDEFMLRLHARLADINVGPATAEGVHMGPVRSLEDVGRLREMIDAGRAGGETVHILTDLEAGRFTPQCCMPLVLLETPPGAESILDRIEAFGPVMSVRKFDDPAQHLERVRCNDQALVTYIYGGDVEALKSAAAMLRHGSVGINTTGIQGAGLPTGGFGHAGLGREGGVEGLREFETTINLRVNP